MTTFRRLAALTSQLSMAGGREDVEKLNDSVDESEDSEVDEMVWHSRRIDPEEADVYLDAFFGPLFFRYERIRKDKDPGPRFSDYRMVSLFLLLNALLQLAIAWKIDEVSESAYGSIGTALFHGACVRMSSENRFGDALYPSELENSNDFDCLQPTLTLSMLPHKLDLNEDGFWSTDEARSIRDTLEARGNKKVGPMPEVLHRMAKYDFENRIGSKSQSENPEQVNLDMKFFEHFRGQLEMCLPIDPNLCGNLEVRGKLQAMLPKMTSGHERVVACRENFETFCVRLFGGEYQWIHYVTGEVCGASLFSREKGINVVAYSTVTTYKGESDSILGKTFVSFLVLLLFIWGMFMIVEWRSTYNFLYVVWYTPSTANSDPLFASFEEGKLTVKRLPMAHKIFAVLCIGIPRGIIAVVVLIVGARFLSATNNLQDLVLNTTALCFLIEVDNIIHASFLGESFEKRVSHRCEVMQVSATAQETSQSYVFLVVVLLTTAAWTAWVYFNPFGLQAIGDGMECLCHFAGNYCLGKELMN